MHIILDRLSRIARFPIGGNPGEENVRFNYALGVLNGAMFMFGFSFLHPNTVLPVFVNHFTDSDFLVGLGSATLRAGWFLPQIFVAGYIENLAHKRGLYIRANIIRMTLIWLTVPLLAFCGMTHPGWTLAGFFVLIGLSAVCGGIAGLPFSDIVGKTIPGPYLGQFYATRLFLGAGVLSVFAGIIIKFVLREGSPYYFPENYMIIFSIGAAFMTIGVFAYGFVREPPSKISETRRTFREIIRNIPSLIRQDRNYGRLLAVLVLASGLGFSLPFYVILAQEKFGAPISAAGTFLAAQTLGVILSNIFWGWLSSRSGNLRLIHCNTCGQIFIPVYALLLFYFGVDFINAGPDWLVTVAFAPIFFFVGAFISGGYIGYTSYLLAIAPEERRPTYVGITNTLMGASALFPAFGGICGELFGISSIFYISCAFTACGFILSLGLRNPQ